MRRALPALSASAVLILLVALLEEAGLRQTARHLVYPLDDAYIHMAVARNLSEHGVWGVTREGFTSCTSSLLWPLLLAAFWRLGARTDWLPVALNLAAGMAALAVAARALREAAAGWRVLILLALVLLTPLTTVVVSAMEHTLHVAATLLLAGLFVGALEHPEERGPWALGAAAAAAAALRYESLFLVGGAAAILAFRGRRRAAVVLSLGAAVPVLAYALVSLSFGWYALPNSVVLKGAHFDPRTAAGLVELLGGRSLRMLSHAPHVLVLVLACLALLAFLPGRPALRGLQCLFVITTFVHMQLADTGWLYRYEAYLVALGIFTLGWSLAAAAPPWPQARRSSAAALAALVLVAAHPLGERAVRALWETPRAARNIFDQQYQMGLFVRRFYSGAAVAANDIGAVCYLADVRLLDLYGLASMEVARARQAGGPTRQELSGLTARHHSDVVVVYRSWFGQSLPTEWQEAGSWRAPEQVVVADRVVTFYSSEPAGRARLVRSLQAFQAEMPAEVTVRLRDGPDVP